MSATRPPRRPTQHPVSFTVGMLLFALATYYAATLRPLSALIPLIVGDLFLRRAGIILGELVVQQAARVPAWVRSLRP